MTGTVFLAVLLAALLHAAWNALVKSGGDKLASMAGVSVGHALPGLACALALPPPAPESWPWIVASALLHCGYQWFLLNAYALGDFTRAYPLARGQRAGDRRAGLGPHPRRGAERRRDARRRPDRCGLVSVALARRGPPDPKAVAAALLTGLFIAAYTLVDGTGARLSGSAVAFYAWASIGNAMLVAAFLVAHRPGLVRRLPRQVPAAFFGGGLASFAAYAIVIWPSRRRRSRWSPPCARARSSSRC